MKGSVMISSTGTDFERAVPTVNACTTSSSASSDRISSIRNRRDEWIVIVLSANVDPFCNQSQLRRRQEARMVHGLTMIRTVKPIQKIRTRVDGAAGRDRRWQDHSRIRRNTHDKLLLVAREQQLSIRGADAGIGGGRGSPQIQITRGYLDDGVGANRSVAGHAGVIDRYAANRGQPRKIPQRLNVIRRRGVVRIMNRAAAERVRSRSACWRVSASTDPNRD